MVWPIQMTELTTTILTVLVLVVAFYDLRERRIPNFLVFPAMLIGVVIHLLAGARGAFADGLQGGRLAGLVGLVVGFLLLLIPYVVGGMKAGDVKFLMAIGALAGWSDAVRILLAAVLFYPVMAVFYVVRERKMRLTWLRFRRVFWNFLGFFMPGWRLYALRLEGMDTTGADSVRTPFGVALAVGTLIVIMTDDWPIIMLASGVVSPLSRLTGMAFITALTTVLK